MKKTLTIALSFTLALLLVTCKAKQKTVSGSSAQTNTVKTSTTGIFEPGDNELQAAKVSNADVTIENLKNGHQLYIGVCTNCHGAKSIYKRSVTEWPSIINDMAAKSKLTQEQKDDLSKYVFAIKATQPK